MKTYLVTITMEDGSVGEHCGAYADAFAATLLAMAFFPGYSDIHVRAKP